MRNRRLIVGLGLLTGLIAAFVLIYIWLDYNELRQCLMKAKSLKAGMKWSEADKMLELDGGLQSFSAPDGISRLRYIVKGCRCGREGKRVKVYVDSKVVHCASSCQQVVTKVSEPFCEFPVGD